MKKLIISFFFLFTMISSHAQDIAPFKIYKENGKETTLKRMLKALKKSELILFGELHNSAICHWLQYETSVVLLESNNELLFGAEMFEADNQQELDDYLAGLIDADALDTLARLWNNYETDYAPLIDLAKDSNRPFIASNIPRRYASMVYHHGFGILDSLSAQEKKWIAPLPIPYDPDLPGYKAMLKMAMGHGGENLPKAQAIKDATMGHFISQNLRPGNQLIHFNGTYHSGNFEGILYYVLLNHPEIEFTTISSVVQENVHELEDENKGNANFIIAIDENMTTTY